MKKDFLKLILATLFICFISTFINVGNSSASLIKESELKQLYDELIEENVIDSSTLSFEEWSKVYIEGKEFEEEIKKEIEKDKEGLQTGSPLYTQMSSQTVSPAYTQMKAGDIFVTTSTVSSGITGHAAIAISSTAILHMPGPGRTSEIMSYAEWKNTYNDSGSKTWIYRHSDSSLGQNAANWARINYWNYKGGGTQTVFPKYSLTGATLVVTDPSYCSKLVWQSYNFSDTTTVRFPYLTSFVPPYYLRPEHVNTMWNKKPKLVSTITNY